jgi:hypothetical protein
MKKQTKYGYKAKKKSINNKICRNKKTARLFQSEFILLFGGIWQLMFNSTRNALLLRSLQR